jgi:hypothetical protein
MTTLRFRLAATLAVASVALTPACGRDADRTPQDPEEWEFIEIDTDAGSDATAPPEDTGPDVPITPPDVPPPLGPTGSACDQDSDCEGGLCVTDVPDGYCTATCSEGTCAATGGGTCLPTQDGPLCVDDCASDSECRDGYECRQTAAGSFCLSIPVTGDGAADGEACGDGDDCGGGTCVGDGDGWPDGYCTTLGCRTFEDCARPGGEDNRCLQNRGGNFCVRICTSSDECREGYVCQRITSTEGFCSPDPSEPIEIDPTDYPFPITCQDPANPGDVAITYEVPAGSTAYMFTPFARDGGQVGPFGIDTPSGQRVNLRGANGFQLIQAQLSGWNNPTVIPATPNFAGQLEQGTHTYDLETDSAELCHYMLSESTPGTTIDMNVYLVGVTGLDASNAGNDPDMTAMLDAFDSIFVKADVQLGTVRFFDASSETAQAYSVIRSENDYEDLVRTSILPGPTYDDAVSINVFFTRAFALGGAIGVSTGIPGPAALHGTRNSGVVFTAEFLGQTFREGGGQVVDGNLYTGIVLAHEVGHYLGLFHTTEQGGRGQDPLDDTPFCPGNQFPNGCADLGNLMFPFASADHTDVTDDQSWVIQVNPLTKD